MFKNLTEMFNKLNEDKKLVMTNLQRAKTEFNDNTLYNTWNTKFEELFSSVHDVQKNVVQDVEEHAQHEDEHLHREEHDPRSYVPEGLLHELAKHAEQDEPNAEQEQTVKCSADIGYDVLNTKFFQDPENIRMIDESVEGAKQRKKFDTTEPPSFSLGLTQEHSTPKESDLAIIPSTSTHPKEGDAEGPKEKRIRKPASCICSPYMKRTVDVGAMASKREKSYSVWFFTMQGDPM